MGSLSVTEESLRYGFIGLGVMGWGMANNLRSKLPKASSFVVCELVKSRRDEWVAQAPGVVSVANSPREVAEQSVSKFRASLSPLFHDRGEPQISRRNLIV